MAAPSRGVSKQSQLLSWGANSYGQLGQGHQTDLNLPRSVNDVPDDVIDICGGGGHTLFLTDSGKCYACGWNNKGQLGLGSCVKDKEVISPQPLDGKSLNEKISHIAAGWDHSMLVSESGSLYSFGSNAFNQLGCGKNIPFSLTPELVSIPSEPVQDVACGMRHTIILAGNDVYTCGIGKKGQLGHCSADGKAVVKTSCFEKVSLPQGHGKVVQVAAGANHSAAVTDTGQLILWGDNKHGQLATDPGVTSGQPLPVIVPGDLFNNQNIIEVHSGWTHMVALTDGGLMYTWGRSQYGQLGVPRVSIEESPFNQWQPHLLEIRNPKKIVCGAEHSLLISDEDELFCWGWNEHGMCGTGDNKDVFEAQKVKVFDKVKVMAIGCGSGHSFALTLK